MNTNRTNEAKAAELEAKADLLDSALLAPSMKSDSYRAEAAALRAQADLAALFATKFDQAKSNGASDDQALAAIRSLWLEALGA